MGFASGPQGYRRLREFSCRQAQARPPAFHATNDDILMVSGSLQALDLIKQRAPGSRDTVFIEQETTRARSPG